MDEFVLCHRPALESHFIVDDQIPMDPRDLLVCMGNVFFAPIWSKKMSFYQFPSGGAELWRTEIQLAHNGGLLNGVAFRLDLIEGIAGGFVDNRRTQRRALSKE